MILNMITHNNIINLINYYINNFINFNITSILIL